MTTPPDPSAIDWGTVALWAGGIGTGIGSMLAATYLAIRKAVSVSKAAPSTITTREETKIVTTDTVAMNELAASVEAVNVALLENRAVYKDSNDLLREIRDLLKAEIAERNKEEDKERIKREVMEDLRRESEIADRQRPTRRAT